ncbi:hypothetical protein EOA25_35325, partial [Mesorhizobium sp. M2A.F.Ca.ET.040.01.1.1]
MNIMSKHWTTRRYAPVIVGTALFLTSCANYPQQARMAAFGAAATDLSSASKAAFTANVDIARQRAEEEGLVAYLEKGPVFMPDYESMPVNSTAQWGVRLRMIEAIGDYAEALSKTGEPGAAEKAAASSKTLATSVAALSKAAGATAGPVVQAAPDLVAGFVRLGADAALSGRMRSVMIQTDPHIRQAVSLLKADFEVLAKTPQANTSGLTMARTDLLRDLRADRRNSSTALVADYREVISRERDAKAVAAAFDQMPDALQKLADAHHALVTSTDSDRAVADFFAASDSIVA